MQLQVVPYSPADHLSQTVEMLLNVRRADPTYPPSVDAEFTALAFEHWLIVDKVLARWVALSGTKVVGHIALAEPHDYISSFFSSPQCVAMQHEPLGEIVKFFVDPSQQGRGVGATLLRHTIDSAWELGRQPVLAVVSESRAARRLYARMGLTELGIFDGIHGRNHVFLEEKIPR